MRVHGLLTLGLLGGLLFLPGGAGIGEAGGWLRCRNARHQVCESGAPRKVMRGAISSNVRMTTSTFSEVSPGDGTYMITDNDGTVKILVDIDFDPGWYAMPTYLPRAKVFPTEQLAKDAAVSPPPPVTEGYQLTPKSGNTWHGDVKLANFNATDPGKNNNWIVIWTVSTTGDADEFYDVHRLPPQGSSYGWRVKRQ